MKTTRAVGLVVSLMVMRPLVAAEPVVSTHQQAAFELLEVMHVEQSLKDVIDIMIKVQLEGNPDLVPFEDVLRGFLSQYMAWDAVHDDYARLYVEMFTEPEIRQLSEFYRTELGQKLVASLPDIMRKGAALGQSKVASHLDELKQLVAKRVEELKNKEKPK